MSAVDLPLPIPNREVKPERTDGTAMKCGRVGGCLFFLIVINCITQDGLDKKEFGMGYVRRGIMLILP